MAASGVRLLGWAVLSVGLAFFAAASPDETALATATACSASIDGRDITTAQDPGAPITVRLDRHVQVDAQLDAPPTSISIAVLFGAIRAEVYRNDHPPSATTYHDAIDGRPYAVFGAGLYQVQTIIDQCVLQAWVRVETDTPLLTLAGGIAIILLLTGLVVEVSGLFAALRGNRAWWRALIGGAVVGISLLLLTQQLGWLPIDPLSVGVWTVVPGLIGGAFHFLTMSLVPGVAATAPAPDVLPPTAPAYPLPPPQPTPPAYAPAPPGGPPPASPPTSAAMPPGAGAGGALRGAAAPPPTTGASGPPTTTPTPSSGNGAGAGAQPEPAGAEQDPPRESYARLECDDAVVAEQEFELRVGLSPTPAAQVVGGPMRRPDISVGPYVVTIQVVADAFRLTRPDESWRVDLPVTTAAPYPSTTLHLAATAQQSPVAAGSVRGVFSVDGQPIGLAIRPVAIVADAALLRQAPRPFAQPAIDVQLPKGPAPDLTVSIQRGDGPPGRLLFQLLAADPEIVLPDAPIAVDIGDEPREFLKFVIREMNSAEGRPGLYLALRGIGVRVAEHVPEAVWAALSAIAARVTDRSVALLILSAEPYVPWELAVMDQPLDPALPPFLCAQVDVGRWVLGQHRPTLPPPATVAVKAMAVVSGIYDANPQWQRLEDAEKEAAELAQRYEATPVDAREANVVRLLEGRPRADLLHFAVHGQYDPQGTIDGLVLVDGALDPNIVTGSELAGSPFVFLNACQVGAGNAVLGDYAGMAEAFLYAGASGVIAPLWSIDDVLARELAMRFYEKALAGDPPAAVLRAERRAFRRDPSPVSSTYLAYQYFGHPRMKFDAPGRLQPR